MYILHGLFFLIWELPFLILLYKICYVWVATGHGLLYRIKKSSARMILYQRSLIYPDFRRYIERFADLFLNPQL
jgi:hypothetical protein